MKKIFLLLLSLFLGSAPLVRAFAAVQAEDGGRWVYHLAYRDAQAVLSVGQNVYAVFNGNLIRYDVEDESVTYLDRRNGLSDKDIISMAYCWMEDAIVLLYRNNNIDLLYGDGTVVNIPQVKDYTEVSLTASRVTVSDRRATVSTDFGVVVLNLTDKQVRSFYNIGRRVQDAFITNETLFISTDEAVYKGLLTDNLYDFSQWTRVYDFPATGFVPFVKGAYMFTPLINGKTEKFAGTNYIEQNGEDISLNHVSPIVMTGGQSYGQEIVLHNEDYVVTIHPEQPYKEAQRLYLTEGCRSVTLGRNGTFWFASAAGNLYYGKPAPHLDDASVQTIRATPAPFGEEGPLRDECYRLSVKEDGRLYVSGGRYRINGEGKATSMILDNGRWHIFSELVPGLPVNIRYRCVMDMIPDALDADACYLATPMGLLHFKNYEYTDRYDRENSPLRGAKGTDNHPNYTIVNGLAYDKDKNLWMCNAQVENTLHALKPNGEWVVIRAEKFTNQTCPERINFDERQWAWVTSREWGPTFGGIYCLDNHGTLEEASDDRERMRSAGTNEDGREIKFYNVYDYAFDREGWLWFGSDEGIYALKDPSEWFNPTVSFYQPKVPRNDGTNYADYLLTGVKVNALTVDGANQKWIGTQGSGLYLVSPDGSEILRHFTTADSPLLSDNIEALAIDPSNGTLFIGTDIGLCQYDTHIIPAAETLDKSNIRVYPNPVRPEYRGDLHITGLTEGAQVKILSAASRLVASGSAVGGTFSWDLTNHENGERVASGVYLIFVAGADGKKAVAAKVAII